MGTVALIGGNEFRTDCLPMDLWMLQHVARKPPHVVILPTAAANEDPEIAAENGIRHFNGLSATAQAAMVVDRASANDPAMVAMIDQADMVYLTGGSPWLLLDTLRDSAVLLAIRRLEARGGIVVGSSAGAMVMADRMRQVLAASWMPALGLIEKIAVLPHYNRAMNANYQPLRDALDPRVAILGIEEGTGCVRLINDPEWHVVGVGHVTVFTTDQVESYRVGDCFDLPETNGYTEVETPLEDCKID